MWFKIKDFPTYEITKDGQVRNSKTHKILSQCLGSKGYYQINIGGKCRRLHVLLAQTFIENPLNLETVNHKDGNKINNNLSNLEWLSRADNCKHARIVLSIIPLPYSKSSNLHHLIGKKGAISNSGKALIAIFKDGHMETFGSAYEAAFKIFGNEEWGKHIRQSIKRNSNYKGIKFLDHDSNY